MNRPEIYGTTMLAHLGPPRQQFKIVRLLVTGRRVIVDQEVPVLELAARSIYALAA